MNAHKLNGPKNGEAQQTGGIDLEWDSEGSTEWENEGEFLAGKRREVRNAMDSFFLSENEVANGASARRIRAQSGDLDLDCEE